MKLATVATNGWRYAFTDEDYDVACRGVFGEVEKYGATWEGDAHLWAILHGMYLRKAATYADSWRAFSSALKPDQEGISDEVRARRRRIAAMALADIPSGVRDRVVRWMRGGSSLEQEGQDFRALRFFDACRTVPENLGAPAIRGPSGQCYWRTAAAVPSFAWSGGRRLWPWVLLGTVLAGTGIAVAVVLVRRRRARSMVRWN